MTYTEEQINLVLARANNDIIKFSSAIGTINETITNTHGDHEASTPVIAMLDAEMRKAEKYADAAAQYRKWRISATTSSRFGRRTYTQEQIDAIENDFAKALFWAEH